MSATDAAFYPSPEDEKRLSEDEHGEIRKKIPKGMRVTQEVMKEIAEMVSRVYEKKVEGKVEGTETVLTW